MKRPPGKELELLLEIGTEEIPYAALESLREKGNNLGCFIEGLLGNALLPGYQIATYQTPRRITLHVKGIAPSFEEAQVIQGPRREICYTAGGQPTQALEGFLKKNRISLKDVSEEDGRILIRRTNRIVTAQFLKEKLPWLVGRLAFPKMMRWDESGVTFPRPIRWILSLYGGKPLSFKMGGLAAGAKTIGLGPARSEKSVRNFKDYGAFLKREGILLEACRGTEGERRRRIRQDVERELKRSGGSPQKLNRALLDEVTNLVERPAVFAGTFNGTYLKLPKEILIASMAKYQRLFSVETANGKLLPNFIACANGRFRSLAKIRSNYEQVLNARLADAAFFYEEDTKEKLVQKRERLKQLTYHQRLGSMYDKSERMRKLASHLAKRLSFDEKTLARACELAKNDLVTAMVKEFPSLQGIVGGHYARISGEPEEVAQAIREQYLPKGEVAEELPATPFGSALSFLEKLDHLVGCFYAGESPTGSSDPYGLRRSANGVFKIILSEKWSLSLSEMVEANAALLDKALTAQKDRGERLASFLKERLKAIFKEEGYREDLIDAVLKGPDDPVGAREKLASLSEMMKRQKEQFLSAFKVIERTHNILKPIHPKEREGMEVRPDLFRDDIEKELWSRYNKDQPSITKLIGESAWAKATERYGEVFADVLHEFFEKVMVNAEDPQVRRNRLALMKEINELYTGPVADLSKLVMNT